MKPIRKAFLLAAGLGTRLRPLTNTIPKCMVPIHGRPLCDYWFALCEAHGIDEILMNTHYLPVPVREYVANLERRVQVRLVHEETLAGSAGTVRDNRAFLDGEDAFLVLYADNLSNANLSALTAFHASHEGPVTMGVFRTQYPEQCGIATVNEEGLVTAFEEKPQHPTSNLANAGVYVADVSTVADIPREDPIVDYGRDILPRYVGAMYAHALDCFHLDIGNLEAYEQAQQSSPADFVI